MGILLQQTSNCFTNIINNHRLWLTGGTYCADKHIHMKKRIKEQKFSLLFMMRLVCPRTSLNAEVPMMLLVTVGDLRKPTRHGGVTKTMTYRIKDDFTVFCLWARFCFMLIHYTTSLPCIIFLLIKLVRRNCGNRSSFTSLETNKSGKHDW